MKKLFTFTLLLALSLGCSSKKETTRQNQPTEELEILETSGQEKIDWSFVDGPPPGFSGRPKREAPTQDFHGKANKPISRISEFEKTKNTLAKKEAEPSGVTNRISNGTGEKEPQPDFRESEKKNHNTPFLLTLGAMAVAGIFSVRRLFRKRNRMNDWAAENPKKSIALLALSRIGLAGMALLGGHYLGTQGVVTTEETTFGLLGLSALTYAVGSAKTRKKREGSLVRKKIAILLMTLLGLGLVANMGNRGAHEEGMMKYSGAHLEKMEQKIEAFMIGIVGEAPPEDTKVRDSWRVALAFFLTLLTVTAGLALFIGALILACQLSCSGHEQAAVMVAILGLIVSVVGAFLLIRYIWRTVPYKKIKSR